MKVFKNYILYTFLFIFVVALFMFAGCAGEKSTVNNSASTTSYNASKKTNKPSSTPTSTATPTATATPDGNTSTPTSETTPSVTPDGEISNISDVKPVFSMDGGFYFGNPSVSVSLSAKDKQVLKENGIENYSIKVSYSQEEPNFQSLNYTKEITLPHTQSNIDNSSKFTTEPFTELYKLLAFSAAPSADFGTTKRNNLRISACQN